MRRINGCRRPWSRCHLYSMTTVPNRYVECRSLPQPAQDPFLGRFGAHPLYEAIGKGNVRLSELGTITVSEVSAHATDRAWVKAALQQFHYLGFSGTVGENLQYLVRDGQGRALACLVFGAAAWKCQDRDRWIGWSIDARRRHLPLLANNQRFLIMPWTRVAHLASWTLGQVMQRLSADWHRKYGHRLALVETFVEQPRFAGTAYRAANWVKVGRTTGRTRQDATRSIQTPVKDVYLYLLRRDFREMLHA